MALDRCSTSHHHAAMIITDSQLVAMIDNFLALTGWSKTRFGVQCCNDKHLVRQLRAGRSVSLRKAAHIVDFMRRHDPEIDITETAG